VGPSNKPLIRRSRLSGSTLGRLEKEVTENGMVRHERKFFDHWWLLRLGIVLLVLGSGPLLVTIALAKLGLTSDPNRNPVELGILAMLTFWPTIVMIVVGVVLGRRSRGQSSV
ncbi:MAG TPA: hypothetical protein VNJ04_16445, partial [Gemmatimonadaceae bacterium]|nr:hypothetical protein [Gemmatimonadaceae bacterium]